MEYNSEPIPKMVERLRAEHRDFRLELIQLEEASKFSSHKAIEILKEIGKSILRHEVEEEARIIRPACIILLNIIDPPIPKPNIGC